MSTRRSATAQAQTRTTILSEDDVQRVGSAIRTCLVCARRDANTAAYANGDPKSADKRRFEQDHLRRVTEIAAAFRFTTGYDAFAAAEDNSASHDSFMARMGF